MVDFFQQYFVDPLITQGVAGYNIFNTPVYAICFALAVFGAYKLLRRLNVKIDRSFLVGILPFILSGGVWRVVRDANLIESPFLVTPLIYFVLFAVTIAALLVSVVFERVAVTPKLTKRGPIAFAPTFYYKMWFMLGIVVLALGFAMLAPLGVQNWNAFGTIAALSVGWAIVFALSNKLSRKVKAFAVFTKENAALLWVHTFDASTTFTALQFFADAGYYEQHIVSNAVISAVGPVGQFLLKLVVLIPVLWLVDRELPRKEDAQLRGFIKIAILILGLALGVRNGLRLGLGV